MAGDNSIRVGRLHVDVSPNLDDFNNRARAQATPEARELGREIGRIVAEPIARMIADAIHDGLKIAGALVKEMGRRAGSEYGESFGQAARLRIIALLRNMPDVRLGADTTEVIAAIERIRERLRELNRDQADVLVDVNNVAALGRITAVEDAVHRLSALRPTIYIDVDSAAAMARLYAVHMAVFRLSQLRPTIPIDVDIAAAMAQIALLRAQLAALQGQLGATAVQVSTTAAAGGMMLLLALAATLAPVIVAAAAVASAALAGIATAALVGAGGLGVLILGVSGVVSAVTAMGAAEKEAGQAAGQAAAKQAQVASAIDGVKSAVAGLAQARANAADAEQRSARQVEDATRSLARAHDEARRAQVALTQAREDARRQMEDLENRVIGGALAQRQANLDITRAKEDLDRTLADPTADEVQREQARITYEQAVQRLRELELQNKRLGEEKKASDKAGVNGSKQVIAAQDGIKRANEGVIDAQQRLADAVRAQTAQQRQSAYSIAQAQQGVVAAQRSLTQAMQASGSAGGAAMNNLREAMARLTPEGRAFALFLYDVLRPQLGELRKTAERGLLPGLQAGITAMLPLLPLLNRFIGVVAAALGDLAEAGGKALAGPFWRRFFAWLTSIAGPSLTSMAGSVGNLAEAFAGLLMAFSPTSESMAEGLLHLTERFADWATTLDQDQGFQEFLGYVEENGPKFVKILGDIGNVLLDFAAFLAPLGALMLDGLVWFFDWLAGLDTDQFSLLATAISVLVAAFVGLAGGPFGVLVAALVGVAAGVTYAYENFEGFRNLVNTVWNAIAAGAVWLWQTVLQPTWNAIVGFLTGTLGPWFLWLWREVLDPAWRGIAAAISWAWTKVISPALAALSWYVRNIVGPWFSWLYEHVIKPVWLSIQTTIKVGWAIIQVIFGLIQIALKILGWFVMALWRDAFKPTWDLIVAGAKWVWDKVKPFFTWLGGVIKDYVVPAFKTGVTALGKAWDAIIDMAKKPVRFVMETVLNNGILAAYNKVAKIFAVKPDDVHIDLPKGFATGGAVWGTGTETSDSILARLSVGEHVLTAAEVRGLGGHEAVHAMRAAARRGQRRVPGFAGGGIVGWLTDKASDAASWAIGNLAKLADPIADRIRALFDQIPGGGPFVQMLRAIPERMVRGLTAWITGKDNAAATQVSPNLREGMSTPSVQAILSIARRFQPDVQLTSGYRPGDPGWHGRGLAADMIGGGEQGMVNIARGFYNMSGNLLELLHSNGGPGDRGYWVKNGRRVGRDFYAGDVAAHYNHVHVAATREALGFDSGGYLPPGISTVFNGTGRPEPVLTNQQWNAVQNRRGGDRPAPQFTIHEAPHLTPEQLWTSWRNAETLYGPPE